MFTGVPSVAYRGFSNGQPVLDFRVADRQMQAAKDLGFLAVDSYGAAWMDSIRIVKTRPRCKPRDSRTTASSFKEVYTAI